MGSYLSQMEGWQTVGTLENNFELPRWQKSLSMTSSISSQSESTTKHDTEGFWNSSRKIKE
jgi:pterin-4a-carbinolamine dehydratase